MELFFEQTYRYGSMVLAVLLVAGCTAWFVPSGQEDVSSSTSEAQTPEGASPIGGLSRDAAAQQEEALSRRQIEEYAKFQKLLEDLARYSNLSAEEVQRTQTELNNRASTAVQGGDGGNRVRLAYLLSLHPSGLNDQRAISLLETVAKSERASASLQHLANILRMQIQEKQRALQRLEALRDVDRRLLEERISDSKTPSPKAPSRRP
ncbi:MAG: hypothetical protein LBI16_00420 [Burkholderiales bacterium]|jgi:hypothetical protein|nr:hypothetical protein [Burkholderiales bacterium]